MIHIETFENGTPIPLLDYVAITDPCYVIPDDTWKEFLTMIKPGRNAYIVKITSGDGEAWLLFGDTAYGDGSFDWEAQGDSLLIDTEKSSGDIFVDAGLVGIVSFNEEAVRCGLVQNSIDDELTLKKPGRTSLKRAGAVELTQYVDGNFEFTFDADHDIQKCWVELPRPKVRGFPVQRPAPSC